MNQPDISIPLRTGNGLNAREHWRQRDRRVRSEREAVGWMLLGKTKPSLPCIVTLTRVAPSKGLDDDNLSGALKAVRDQVAEWLGVDDGDRDRVRYEYTQHRGPWGVEIRFATLANFLRAVEGLRPLGRNEAMPELRMLTARQPDGFVARIVCSVCRQEGFEKRGDLYHCWNCNGDGDVLEANGDGWRKVKATA